MTMLGGRSTSSGNSGPDREAEPPTKTTSNVSPQQVQDDADDMDDLPF
jgi:hypothetical protein